MADSCPTCGQAVELHTGSGGTSSYVKAAEVERDSLRSLLVEAREALEEAIGWAETYEDHMSLDDFARREADLAAARVLLSSPSTERKD